MNKQRDAISNEVAYRWLAQFFLNPPSLPALESYRSKDGRAFLVSCKEISELAPVAAMIEAMVAPEVDLTATQSRFASAFSQAFDVGGPRSAPPYASVYFSERGLLCQQPARDMNRVLDRLQMGLMDGVNEPADHLGVQLHVAAELCAREMAGQPVPLSNTAFLEVLVLSWLPAFLARCEALQDPVLISTFARAALRLVRADVEAQCWESSDPAAIELLAHAALEQVRAKAGLPRKLV